MHFFNNSYKHKSYLIYQQFYNLLYFVDTPLALSIGYFFSVLSILADVMNYCIQMSQVLNVDIIDIINAKMDKTEKKYPIDKAKGVATKYNKL